MLVGQVSVVFIISNVFNKIVYFRKTSQRNQEVLMLTLTKVMRMMTTL